MYRRCGGKLPGSERLLCGGLCRRYKGKKWQWRDWMRPRFRSAGVEWLPDVRFHPEVPDPHDGSLQTGCHSGFRREPSPQLLQYP